jgi:hypothetical protein
MEDLSRVYNKENYGEKFHDHLVEQYKIYVEMADRLSARRNQINSFYISVLSSLLALLVLITNKDIKQFNDTTFQYFSFLAVGILGLILCIVWYLNIQSYRHLSSSKFKVINELEALLPFPCYEHEWQFIKQDRTHNRYFIQTALEKLVPVILAIPYSGLVIYSIIGLLR